jgi:AraC-like DNA-binding protein
MKPFNKDVGRIITAPFKSDGIELHDWSFRRELLKRKNFVLKSPHFHDDYQLGYTQQGTIKNTFRNREHFIPPNTFYAIPPEIIHAESLTNEQPLSFNFMFIPKDIIDKAIVFLTEDNIKKWCFYGLYFSSKYQNKVAVSLFSDFFRSLYNSSTELEQESNLIRLLYAVQSFALHNPPIVYSDLKSSTAILRAKEFINCNFNKKLTLEEISSVAYLSKYHLLRTFHKETGMPIHQYQLQLKIAQAKKWLKAGKPIADVAFELGFNDQSHFTNTFKRNTAQLPKKFKQQYFTIFSP